MSFIDVDALGVQLVGVSIDGFIWGPSLHNVVKATGPPEVEDVALQTPQVIYILHSLLICEEPQPKLLDRPKKMPENCLINPCLH